MNRFGVNKLIINNVQKKYRCWYCLLLVFFSLSISAAEADNQLAMLAADSSSLTHSSAIKASDLPFSSGETLYYKLSYRGLLTSMIWADLADVRMTFSRVGATPDKHEGYQFELYLSTENYSKAELFQPVRYTYTSTLDASLQRTLLVEEEDIGENQSHDFLWLDWTNKKTQLFKKREKKQQFSGFLGLHVEEAWEPDGVIAVPNFLGEFPLLDNHLSYLIHKESGDPIVQPQVLEPLSLIYALRIQDFEPHTNEVKEVAIAVSDDIRLYRVQKELIEDISLNGETRRGIKFKIQTDEKKENYYYVWLSDDKKKIPLRMAMDAPLGKLEIDLMRVE